MPGAEVAVEGLLRGGALEVLALFDKPDPLDGPYFEETIYVTPSRHPAALQREIERIVAAAARALGLARGPLHAELRLSPRGPVGARDRGALDRRPLLAQRSASARGSRSRRCSWRTRWGCRSTRPARAARAGRDDDPNPAARHPARGARRGRGARGAGRGGRRRHRGAGPRGGPAARGRGYSGSCSRRRSLRAEVEAALREAHRRLELDIRAPLPTV